MPVNLTLGRTVLRQRRSKVLFQCREQFRRVSRARRPKVDTLKCHRARHVRTYPRAPTGSTCCVLTSFSHRTRPVLFLAPLLLRGEHAPFSHKHQHRHTKSELAKKAAPQDTPKGPLQIIISIADQQISLYDNGALIARSSVSTGVQGHPTPLGVFSVISKERWHRSNIYSGAPMPYMQRITWSGIALHAGVVPGHPASHGCIRLTNDFAIRLWHLTRRGTRVIIARDDVRPVEIANSHLFVSKPKAASVSPESLTVTVAGDNDNNSSGNPWGFTVQCGDAGSDQSSNSRVDTRRSRASKGRSHLCLREPQVEQALCASGLHAVI